MAEPPNGRDGSWSRTVEFMGRPRDWPCWPFLPLVKGSGATQELGVLFDALNSVGLAGYQHTVFLANLLLLPASREGLLALPSVPYPSFEALADAGWRVD